MSQQVVGAILEMGKSLGANVVAEGVEQDLEADALREIGVRWAQGYLFARPVDPYAEVPAPSEE
jgi:EAL domain-containing protein (putative c-di-GMP-specific phosphodiesterase class I)